MRLREPFTIFQRKIPSGNKVFYYQTYNDQGKRTWARSTGQTTKTAAKNFCIALLKEGKIIPEIAPKRTPTLREFGENFWVHGKSEFLKYREQRGYSVSKSHALNQARYFRIYIDPALGKKRLDQIATHQVETWFLDLKEKGLANQSCNHLLSNLRTILGEALRLGIISNNPVETIKPLSKAAKPRGILTIEEVKRLLGCIESPKYWPSVKVYMVNLIAASTGLRMGEIQALRWGDIGPLPNPDRIIVRHSWDRKFGLKTTKTKKERIIPLSKDLWGRIVQNLTPQSSEDFIFTNTEETGPIHETMIAETFYEALAKIGITDSERKERNITFHGWRHFFNTFLRRQGIQDSKVQMVTGHSSVEMTDHYTHFDVSDLKEVEEAQVVLLTQG